MLTELLRRHPDLRKEAGTIAKDLIDDVTVELVADDVADMVSSIGLEELNNRAGTTEWGYVEPGEAAWELLEESIEDVRNDMQCRMEAGMLSAAERSCLGIVRGLYSARNTKSDGVLLYAPDFLSEATAQAVSDLVEFLPQNRRRAVGKRLIFAVKEQAGSWVEMLQRVVDRAASAKRGRRK